MSYCGKNFFFWSLLWNADSKTENTVINYWSHSSELSAINATQCTPSTHSTLLYFVSVNNCNRHSNTCYWDWSHKSNETENHQHITDHTNSVIVTVEPT